MTVISALLRTTLLLSLLPFTAPALHAGEASESAKVHELFKLMKLDSLSAQMQAQTLDQVKSGIIQQMFGVKVPAAQQHNVDEFSEKVSAILSKAVGWSNLEPEYTKLYTETYTELQIDDLLAFYRSPTGRVMVEKGPILLKQTSGIVQQHIATVTPEVQTVMQEFMKKAAAQAPQSAPPQ
jgi:uncharacterized protein